MIDLPNVTLAACACTNIHETVKAMRYSMKGIQFGDAVFVSHKRPLFLPKDIRFEYTTKNKSIDDFNYKMVYDFYKYIHTEYVLLIHADGFVVNPEMWRDEFLDYDYIGAPWPIPPTEDKITFRDQDGNLCRVGNSVSIRSKRLLEYPSKANMPWNSFYGNFHEDGFICVHHHKDFESAGMKIAPLDVAKYFSHENLIPEIEGIEPFCFHKWAGANSKYPNFGNKIIKLIKRIKSFIVNCFRIII